MKHFFVTLLILISLNIKLYGQFAQANMMYESNYYNLINPKVKNILDAKLIEVNNHILIKWKVIADTIPGYYIVLKSNNFSNLEFVDHIEITHQVDPKIILSHTTKDSLYSPFHNIYHIVKIQKSKMNFNYNEIDLKKYSSINLPVNTLNIKNKHINIISTCSNSENN